LLLAPAGYVLQTICVNPLADPFTLGISSVALLGGIVGIALGSSLEFFPIWVSAGTLVSLFFMILFTRGRGALGPKLILSGVILGFFSIALIQVITSHLKPEILVRAHQLMTGDLGRYSVTAGLGQLGIACVLLGVQLFFSRDLDRMSVGLWRQDLQKWLLPLLLLILSAQITFAVLMVGIVGFLGLLVPHLTKFILKPNHRWGLSIAAIWGSAIAVGSDSVGQILDPPISFSHICILWGAPVFLFLLARRSNL
jgi:iron complex transport system permease protein